MLIDMFIRGNSKKNGKVLGRRVPEISSFVSKATKRKKKK